jgi:hypothetical protein
MSARGGWARWWTDAARGPAVPAAFLCAVAFIFLPAGILAGNAPFFYYPLSQLALVLVPAFVLAWLVLTALASVGPPRWRRIVAALLYGAAAWGWVSGTFITPSHGLLDGRSFLELAAGRERWINLALAVACVAVVAYGAWRRPVVARRFALALGVLLLAQAAWIVMTDDNAWREPADERRLTSLSPRRNVLVVLLDAFQGDFFEDIVQADPALARAFDGFTYFRNAMGSAMTTYLAIPTIHSGEPVVRADGLHAIYRRNVVEGSFVAKLASRGYDAMVVNPMLNACPQGARCDDYLETVYGRFGSLVERAAVLVNISVFRMVPHVAKAGVYRNGKWWTPLRVPREHSRVSNDFLDRMAANVRADSERPVVRFLHLFNSHAPPTLDADCRPVEVEAIVRREAMVAMDHCALRHLAPFLDALRERGLYDTSAILVIADHGSGLPRPRERDFVPGASAWPLIVVKPFGARGPLRTDDSLVGLEDIAATVCAWTGECTAASGGVDLMRVPSAPRSFPFISYVWSGKYVGADAVPLDNVFMVTGPPRDPGSWRRTTNLPQVRVDRLDFAARDPAGSYGMGWSGLEMYQGRDVRWAVGPAAEIYIDLDPAHDQRLAFDMLTHPGDMPQEVRVEVNGQEAGRMAVGIEWSHGEVVVPRALLGPGPDRIVLRFAQHNGTPVDVRGLAVLFDRMTASAVQ